MEDITAFTAPLVISTKIVLPNATPVISTVGKETMDGCYVAEVTPPSPPLTFHVVVKAPLPLAPLAPEIPPGSQLAIPRAPDVAKTGSRPGVILGPRGHKVLVAPLHAPSLAIDNADRRKKRKLKKIDAKLKKRKDRE